MEAGQICFCLSGHRLAEGKDTNVPAVIQRKLSLAIFRSVQGCGSKRLLSYSIMVIIMSCQSLTEAGWNQVEVITFCLVEKLRAALLFICLHISAACKKLAGKRMFACVCLCVTVNKKPCFSTEPHGAERCQHSQPQLPMAAPMLSHDPALGRKLAKYSAFLSCPFQGKVLLSRISPHKPLNTSASTANGLQRCEGNIYNYPRFIQ